MPKYSDELMQTSLHDLKWNQSMVHLRNSLRILHPKGLNCSRQIHLYYGTINSHYSLQGNLLVFHVRLQIPHQLAVIYFLISNNFF